MNRTRTLSTLLVVGALVAASSVLSAVQAFASPRIDVTTPDFASLADGTYRGTWGSGLTRATVDVLVIGGRIQKVTVVAHRWARSAEAIVDRIVASQSLEVDAISGATGSSRAVLKAAEVALTR